MRDSFLILPPLTIASTLSPKSVSANGQFVVGDSNTNQANPSPFLWNFRTNRTIALSTFGGPGGYVRGISSDGRVIVGVADTLKQETVDLIPRGSDTRYISRPCLWKVNSNGHAGRPMDLAELTTDSRMRHFMQGATFFVAGVSADGLTVVGSLAPPGQYRLRAFAWSIKGGLSIFDVLPNFDGSSADAISSDGKMVFGSCAQVTGDIIRARQEVVWKLPDLKPNLQTNCPKLISGDGRVLVRRNDIWERDQLLIDFTKIPLTPDIREFGEVVSLSYDGRIALGYLLAKQSAGTGIYGLYRPFLWTKEQGLRDLQSLVMEKTTLADKLRGWNLQNAKSLSSDGTTVIGEGSDPMGRSCGWHLQIPRGLANL